MDENFNENQNMENSYIEKSGYIKDLESNKKNDDQEVSPKLINGAPYGSKKKMDKGLKVFLCFFFVVVFLIVLFFTSILLSSNLKSNKFLNPFNFGNKSDSSSNSFINFSGPTLDLVDKKEAEAAMPAQDIYKKVVPSIVGIITYNPSKGLIGSSAGQGSGIIMSQDGYIVTNAHVIGNSNKLNVTVVINEKEYEGKVIGFDTRTDLAVLKVEASGLTAAEFGNSDQMDVGEWVLTLGNPGGLEFSNSLTRGIISAKNRSLGAANSTVKYIQTDAPINPGNSGGALLNMHGQVIGINCAKLSENEGMGFAIPINTVKTVVDDIIKNGYVSGRVKLGISVRPISAYEAQINNVPQGLLISEISNDSNIGASGIKVGDIISKVDGVQTITTSSLFGELSKHKPGDVINITLYRPALSYTQSQSSGEYFDAKVTLIEDKGQNQ